MDDFYTKLDEDQSRYARQRTNHFMVEFEGMDKESADILTLAVKQVDLPLISVDKSFKQITALHFVEFPNTKSVIGLVADFLSIKKLIFSVVLFSDTGETCFKIKFEKTENLMLELGNLSYIDSKEFKFILYMETFLKPEDLIFGFVEV